MCTSDAYSRDATGSAGKRRAALAILAAAMAVTGSLAASAASKAVGSKHALQCPPTIVAACKKNEQRVCRQTDSKGCCVKAFCVQR